MKNNLVFGIIIGVILSVGINVVIANTMITSEQVTYNETTVKSKLDEFVSITNTGKSQIATAITSKGVATDSSDSFETMAANINSIHAGKALINWCGYTGYIEDDGNMYVFTSFEFATNKYIVSHSQWDYGTATLINNDYVLIQKLGRHSYRITTKKPCIKYNASGTGTSVSTSTAIDINYETAVFSLLFE